MLLLVSAVLGLFPETAVSVRVSCGLRFYVSSRVALHGTLSRSPHRRERPHLHMIFRRVDVQTRSLAGGYRTVKETVCQPVAPSGTGSA